MFEFLSYIVMGSVGFLFGWLIRRQLAFQETLDALDAYDRLYKATRGNNVSEYVQRVIDDILAEEARNPTLFDD